MRSASSRRSLAATVLSAGWWTQRIAKSIALRRREMSSSMGGEDFLDVGVELALLLPSAGLVVDLAFLAL